MSTDVDNVSLAVLVDNKVQFIHVGVAQLVERGTHKPEVTGSFPVADTIGSISENFAVVAQLNYNIASTRQGDYNELKG